MSAQHYTKKAKVIPIVEAMPACFDSRAQWDGWKALAVQDPRDVGPSSYCTDCTQAYQYKMIRERRCAHPGTTFIKNREGATNGTRPRRK